MVHFPQVLCSVFRFFFFHVFLPFSLRNMKTFTSLKVFPKSFLSLKVHGRIRLLEDKRYAAFVPEAWQLKACVLSRDGYLGSTADVCLLYNTDTCNGVTSHPGEGIDVLCPFCQIL